MTTAIADLANFIEYWRGASGYASFPEAALRLISYYNRHGATTQTQEQIAHGLLNLINGVPSSPDVFMLCGDCTAMMQAVCGAQGIISRTMVVVSASGSGDINGNKMYANHVIAEVQDPTFGLVLYDADYNVFYQRTADGRRATIGDMFTPAVVADLKSSVVPVQVPTAYNGAGGTGWDTAPSKSENPPIIALANADYFAGMVSIERQRMAINSRRLDPTTLFAYQSDPATTFTIRQILHDTYIGGGPGQSVYLEYEEP